MLHTAVAQLTDQELENIHVGSIGHHRSLVERVSLTTGLVTRCGRYPRHIATSHVPASHAIVGDMGDNDKEQPPVAGTGVEAQRVGDTVEIRMGYNEAVVLSELLSRWGPRLYVENDLFQREGLFSDESERLVLVWVEGSLDPVIDEVFSSEYGQVLERARAAVRGGRP